MVRVRFRGGGDIYTPLKILLKWKYFAFSLSYRNQERRNKLIFTFTCNLASWANRSVSCYTTDPHYCIVSHLLITLVHIFLQCTYIRVHKLYRVVLSVRSPNCPHEIVKTDEFLFEQHLHRNINRALVWCSSYIYNKCFLFLISLPPSTFYY